jgi:hypothetical protein
MPAWKHNHKNVVGFKIHMSSIVNGAAALAIMKTYPDGCSVPVQKDDFNVHTGDTIEIGHSPSS